jgi:hypothetical protein
MFTRYLSIICICTLLNRLPLSAQEATPPFTISLEEVTYAGWPGLHSYVTGVWDGYWFMFGGRTGGLHGFLPPNPFMPLEANKEIHMFDPLTGEHISTDLTSLPDDLANQLESTNPQSFQRGNMLYIIGGYGHDQTAMEMRTYPACTAVNLEYLSNAIQTGTDINPAFRTIQDTLFEVTGGEIGVIGDTVYLFGGHAFTGEYSKPAGPQFTQVYTDRLMKFRLIDDGTDLSLADVTLITDTAVFHRRDLNFEPLMLPGEEKALIALSGVFQYEADWPWHEPVIVTADGFYVDESLYQKMNNYTCPVMSIYDADSERAYLTLFGGISEYWFDEDDSILKQDLNIPFVNDISTIIRNADGTMTQYIQPFGFDGLLGSNAEFLINPEIPQYDDKIIQLHAIDGDVLAGYIFGGIDAEIPNFTPSTASNKLFKVWLHYDRETAITSLHQGAVRMYPNPMHDILHIDNQMASTISQLFITDIMGRNVYVEQADIPSGYKITLSLSSLPAGLYAVHVASGSEWQVQQFVKE